MKHDILEYFILLLIMILVVILFAPNCSAGIAQTVLSIECQQQFALPPSDKKSMEVKLRRCEGSEKCELDVYASYNIKPECVQK